MDINGDNLGNSAVSEQTMKVLVSFKHVVMNMRIERQKFFILWLVYDLNQLKMFVRHNKIAQIPTPTFPF